MVLHKTCVGAGCLADPGFGYRSSPKQDYRWACLAHRGLLEVGAAGGGWHRQDSPAAR
jgi:hypothetical protein